MPFSPTLKPWSVLEVTRPWVVKEYNPDEPRNSRGEWTTGGDDSEAKSVPGTTEAGTQGASRVSEDLKAVAPSTGDPDDDAIVRAKIAKLQVAQALAAKCPVDTQTLVGMAGMDKVAATRLANNVGVLGDAKGYFINSLSGDITVLQGSEAEQRLLAGNPHAKAMAEGRSHEAIGLYVDWGGYDVGPSGPYNSYLEAANGSGFSGKPLMPHSGITGDEAVRTVATGQLIRMWATTSNDSSPRSLAMQEAAAKEFPVAGAASWPIDSDTKAAVDSLLDQYGGPMRTFLRTQYNLTQEYFAKAGIKEVTLERGMQFSEAPFARKGYPPSWLRQSGTTTGYVAEVPDRPLSSWSFSPKVASSFGTKGLFTPQAMEEGRVGVVVQKTVPASQILSTPLTGYGCLEEQEAVVLGGSSDAKVVDFQNQKVS